MIPTKNRIAARFFRVASIHGSPIESGRANQSTIGSQATMFRHERQKKARLGGRSNRYSYCLRKKERGAVSVFAGPMSFTAGGPNLSQLDP